MLVSPLESHLGSAEVHMDEQDFDRAFNELEAAVDRFVSYKELVNKSVDHSISRLSTVGCQASAPHPKALDFVRLREKLTT